MKTTLLAAACALALAAGAANAETVRFWYHFDNPENPMQGLVDKFQAANPDITIEAENIPWNSYYDQLYTALIGGSAPDAAPAMASISATQNSSVLAEVAPMAPPVVTPMCATMMSAHGPRP